MLSRTSTIRTELPSYAERDGRSAPAYSFVELPSPPPTAATRLWSRLTSREREDRPMPLAPVGQRTPSAPAQARLRPLASLEEGFGSPLAATSPAPARSPTRGGLQPMVQHVRAALPVARAWRSRCGLLWPKALFVFAGAALLVICLKKFINKD